MPKSRARLSLGRAISSVVERFLHTEEATGSIPVSPTTHMEPPSSTTENLIFPKKAKFWTEPGMSATLLIVCERHPVSKNGTEPSEVLL